MGCGQHPAFPAPSDFRRVNQASNPGAIAQRERELASRRCFKLTWIRAPFSARCASACMNLALCRQAGWLGNLDSNQDKQSQSLLCYRYTIPQGTRRFARRFSVLAGYLAAAWLRRKSLVCVLLPASPASWQARTTRPFRGHRVCIGRRAIAARAGCRADALFGAMPKARNLPLWIGHVMLVPQKRRISAPLAGGGSPASRL